MIAILEEERTETSVDKLVQALAKLPLVASLTEVLIELPDLDLEALSDLITEAEALGLVEGWPECPEGPSVCLSSLSVDRLGLEPCPLSGRWVELGRAKPERNSKPGKRFSRATDLSGPDIDSTGLMADIADSTAQQPLELLVISEEMTTAIAAKTGKSDYITRTTFALATLRRPRLFIGETAAWLTSDDSGRNCPICQGRPLNPIAYCLRCDRSGVDKAIGWRDPSIGRRSRHDAAQAERKAKRARLKGGV